MRKRRLDLGLFQNDAAVTIGVDTTTVYNWENNRTGPTIAGRPSNKQHTSNGYFKTNNFFTSLKEPAVSRYKYTPLARPVASKVTS